MTGSVNAIDISARDLMILKSALLRAANPAEKMVSLVMPDEYAPLYDRLMALDYRADHVLVKPEEGQS